MLRNIPILLKMLCDPKCVKLGWRIHGLFSKNGQYHPINLIKSGLHVIKNDRLVEHENLFIVNSFIPPLNSNAFESIIMAVPGRGDDFFTHHVTGKRNAPISIYIAITAQCMYNCWHCSAAKRNPNGELDTRTMIALVKQMQDMGVGIIGFTGGEPLLRNDLEAIIETIDKRSVCMVFTTGYGLSYERAIRLKASGLWGIAISIDSAVPEEHDRGRGFQGAFEHALAAVKNAKQAGLYTMSQTVCTRRLLAADNLLKLAKRMKEVDIDEMRIIEPLPCGKLDTGETELLTEDECRKLSGFHIHCNKNAALPKAAVFAYFESQEQFGCGAGVQHCYIDHGGNLYPCDFVPVSFGNVVDKPIAELWKEMHGEIGTPRGTCLSKGCLKGTGHRKCLEYPLPASELSWVHQCNDRLPGFYRILRG